MKTIVRLFPLFVAIATSAIAAAPAGWTQDLDKAFADAKRSNKDVLVEFTGSDWCPPCIAMRKNVFTKKEFTDTASRKFVLVEIDFPNGDPKLKEKNEPLAEKYKISAFPTVVLLTSAGKEITRFPASQFPTVEKFLAQLDASLEKKDLD